VLVLNAETWICALLLFRLLIRCVVAILQWITDRRENILLSEQDFGLFAGA
jgi:hypothetical protein